METRSGFWSKFGALELVGSTVKFYKDLKSGSGVIGTSLVVLEKGVYVASLPVGFVTSRWAAAYPQTATTVDRIACECVELLAETVPVLNKPAGEVVGSVKGRTKWGVKRLLRRFPGQQILYVLDKTIDVSETLLGVVSPGEKAIISKQVPQGSAVRGATIMVRRTVAWPLNRCIQVLNVLQRYIMRFLGLRRKLRKRTKSARTHRKVTGTRKGIRKKWTTPPRRGMSRILHIMGIGRHPNRTRTHDISDKTKKNLEAQADGGSKVSGEDSDYEEVEDGASELSSDGYESVEGDFQSPEESLLDAKGNKYHSFTKALDSAGVITIEMSTNTETITASTASNKRVNSDPGSQDARAFQTLAIPKPSAGI